MNGTLVYWVSEGRDRMKTLRLTVCGGHEDGATGLADLRRRRLSRIIEEAVSQGARLSYRDLSMIMLVSKATLKRDISYLRNKGMNIPLGNSRG